MLYVLSIVCVLYIVRPLHPAGSHLNTIGGFSSAARTASPTAADFVAGRPVRIVIPSSYVYQPNQYVDLPVDRGYYSSATNSWTLSGYHAQYDMSSSPANNHSGETFIYGHNNDYVFGAFRHHPPVKGAEARVYTANGHVLAYRFVRSWSLTPTDVSVLNYQGPPVLLVQTCTGSFNEWRTMYLFNYEKVIK
jgi:hypothetical protein